MIMDHELLLNVSSSCNTITTTTTTIANATTINSTIPINKNIELQQQQQQQQNVIITKHCNSNNSLDSCKLCKKVQDAIKNLHNLETRASALKYLRYIYQAHKMPDLSIFLMEATSILVILLYEITDAACKLNLNKFKFESFGRLEDSVMVIACLSENSEGRKFIIASNILYYLCLLLEIPSSNCDDMEWIHLAVYKTFLTIIKDDAALLMSYIDEYELIPLSLRIMERGEEKCTSAAANLLLTLMSNDSFLTKITSRKERLEHFVLVIRKASLLALYSHNTVLHKVLLNLLLCLTKKKIIIKSDERTFDTTYYYSRIIDL